MTIAEALDGQRETVSALRTHLRLLEQERARIARQIGAVRTTLRKTERGEPLMAEEIFDGFDHTRYKDEVIERWGREAYENGDRWWRSLSEDDRARFQQRQADIAGDFARAHKTGLSPDSDEVQAIARRHFEWITAGWQGTRPSAEQFTALGQMYVDDPRFRANYDRNGEGTAAFIRDAMAVFAQRTL